MPTTPLPYTLPIHATDSWHQRLSVLTWTLCGAGAALALYTGAFSWWRVLCVAAGLSAITYAMLWAPRVTLAEVGVVIANPVTTTTYPWRLIEDVETQFQYAVVVGGKRRYAWALPAPSFSGASKVDLRMRRGGLVVGDSDAAGGGRLGDLDTSDCGVAAQVTRRVLAWQRNHASTDVNTTVSSTRNTRNASMLLVALVACAVALLG